MKRVITVSFFLVVMLTVPLSTYAAISDIKIPRNEDRISLSTGGFMLFELGNGEYYLIDTRTGRLWQFLGDVSSPDHFEPVKYEISKGILSARPDNETTNQFPGRFAFEKLRDKVFAGFFILDTITGKIWRLQDSDTPMKLILIPRKD